MLSSDTGFLEGPNNMGIFFSSQVYDYANIGSGASFGVTEISKNFSSFEVFFYKLYDHKSPQ